MRIVFVIGENQITMDLVVCQYYQISFLLKHNISINALVARFSLLVFVTLSKTITLHGLCV